MKPLSLEPGTEPATSRLGRRGMLIGAGAAAAAGAVAGLASRTQSDAPTAPAERARADDAEGYRLSEHVRRYYETART